MLAQLIKEHNWSQVLVFTRTKHGANQLAEYLTKDGIPSLAIHGNKSQSARTRALSEFKDGSLRVLVATDIAARGIDISELPHVVNLRVAQRAGGLRSSHRPYRPCGCFGRSRVAGVRR